MQWPEITTEYIFVNARLWTPNSLFTGWQLCAYPKVSSWLATYATHKPSSFVYCDLICSGDATPPINKLQVLRVESLFNNYLAPMFIFSDTLSLNFLIYSVYLIRL